MISKTTYAAPVTITKLVTGAHMTPIASTYGLCLAGPSMAGQW
jgi:hypothetical protein